MNDLLKRMKKQSVVDTEILKNSRFFNESEFIDIGHPILNLALSGKVDGGFTNGLTIFAGPSKHFKSSYMCMLMAAFLKKNKDGVVIFYDSEFGSKQSYFTNFGVDTSRVLHVPIMNIEELKFDCIKKLEDIKLGEKVMFAIDSVGNLASKKEVEDALGENSAADMTRAKQLKSFGRMVTPYLNIKNIPMVTVNHTYSTMETYSQQVMGGGTGLMYSANSVLFVNRSQNKDANKTLLGYDFDLTVMKSRFIKEASRFPITVSFEGGVEMYSGVFEYALELGFIVSSTKGWYAVSGEDQTRPSFANRRKSQMIEDVELMESLLHNHEFTTALHDKFSLDSVGKKSEILFDDSEE